MSKVLRLAPCLVAIWAALPVMPAGAQGNIDAGKSPAQIFTDTCSACHRSARELRRASSSFLRTHYTTSSDEASVMANYLAGVGSDPRSAQPRQPPRQQPAEPSPATAGKQPPRQQGAEPKSERAEPKSAAQSKGRRDATAQARQQQPAPAPAPVVEEHPPEPPPAPVAPPAPVLEPFEE